MRERWGMPLVSWNDRHLSRRSPVSVLVSRFRVFSPCPRRSAMLADFATVMKAMREGHVPTKAINTHRAPLWEVAAKMPEWIRPEAGTVKALLEV